MDTPNKNMYHFVWNDDDEQQVSQDQQLSPKDRVAKILRETELGDIPDLVFRGSKADSNKSRSKKSHQRLKTEEELFSIDDDGDDYGTDDFTFKGVKLDINDNTNSGNQASNSPTKLHHTNANRQYQVKSPAKVPPVVNKGHPTIPMKSIDTSERRGDNHSETYLDSKVKNSTTVGFSTGERDHVYKDSNTTALLPMDSKFLEMDFDDDVDSGVAIDQDQDHQQDQDTVPIVTVDQTELTERWRKRRQRINFGVTMLIILVGVIVLIVAIVLIVKMIQG